MPNCTTEISDLGLLKRSLLKSSTSDLNQASQERIMRLLSGSEWNEAIEAILTFSRNDRIVNRQPIIAALAFSSSLSTGDMNVNRKIRQAIHKSLSSVLRTPDELFQMIDYEGQFSTSTHRVSTGRCKRSAISAWYNEKAPLNLAKFVTQYKRCCGWTHRDVLRLAHVKPNNNGE
jgi:60 kDa SS-A/Ro ribonucleoprotein